MKQVKCEICDDVIPAERIEILPDTRVCVKCSAKYITQAPSPVEPDEAISED